MNAIQFHTITRFVLWTLATAGVTLALLALMPPGFAGVPFTLVVLAAFLVSFVCVGVMERTRWINVATVAIFWLCLSMIHVTHLGTAAMRQWRLLGGLVFLCALGLTHAAIQCLVHYSVWRVRDRERSG